MPQKSTAGYRTVAQLRNGDVQVEGWVRDERRFVVEIRADGMAFVVRTGDAPVGEDISEWRLSKPYTSYQDALALYRQLVRAGRNRSV